MKTLIIIALFFIGLCIWTKAVYGYSIEQYNHAATVYAQKYNLDPQLVIAIIQVESSYNQFEHSNKGAVGLMQVLPSTYKWICEKRHIKQGNLYDIQTNLDAGTWYLKFLITTYRSQSRGIEAYFGGYKQTRATKRYLNKVEANL